MAAGRSRRQVNGDPTADIRLYNCRSARLAAVRRNRDTSAVATRTSRLTTANVVETTTPVELMGRYSNRDIVARLRRVLSGQGRDQVSHRPVPSLRQKQTRLTDTQRSALVARYEVGESSNALAAEFGIDRRTATAIIRRAGAALRYRVELTDSGPRHSPATASVWGQAAWLRWSCQRRRWSHRPSPVLRECPRARRAVVIIGRDRFWFRRERGGEPLRWLP